MTALENLVAILETLPLSRNERLERAHALLDRFKLSHLSTSVADTLSGGERRRLEIARALTLSPRFLLLDEPFAGIDPITVLDLQHVIRELATSGIGILITDHNVRDTLAIVDRGYIINAGRIFRTGSPVHALRGPRGAARLPRRPLPAGLESQAADHAVRRAPFSSWDSNRNSPSSSRSGSS